MHLTPVRLYTMERKVAIKEICIVVLTQKIPMQSTLPPSSGPSDFAGGRRATKTKDEDCFPTLLTHHVQDISEPRKPETSCPHSVGCGGPSGSGIRFCCVLHW